MPMPARVRVRVRHLPVQLADLRRRHRKRLGSLISSGSSHDCNFSVTSGLFTSFW